MSPSLLFKTFVLRQSKRRIPPPPERGFSLLMAVSIVAFLMVGAAALFDQAGGDLMTASGVPNHQRARLLADRGAQWGQDRLIALLFNDGQSTTPDLTAVQALTPLSREDPICSDGANCLRFRLLSDPPWVTTPAGTFRVALSCDPGTCSGAARDVVQFVIRVLAKLPNGRQALVETSLRYAS